MPSLSTDKKYHRTGWLFLSVLLATLFCVLGVTVKYTSFFDALNQHVLTFLIHQHTHLADIFFVGSTLLCEAPHYYVIGAGLLLWLSIDRRWLLAIHFLITITVVYYASPFLKKVFEITRPFEGVVNIGYAFPSGHTLLAGVAFGFWSVVFTQHLKSKEKYIMMLAYNIPAIIVGVSRLYLGVHWLTDVVGALLASGVIICLSFSIYPPQRSTPIKPNTWFLVIMYVALVVMGYLMTIHFADQLYFYERILSSFQ